MSNRNHNRRPRGATPVKETPPDWPTTWTGRVGLAAASLAGAVVMLGIIYGLVLVVATLTTPVS